VAPIYSWDGNFLQVPPPLHARHWNSLHFTTPGTGTLSISLRQALELSPFHYARRWNSLHFTTPGTGKLSISLRQGLELHLTTPGPGTSSVSIRLGPELSSPHNARGQGTPSTTLRQGPELLPFSRQKLELSPPHHVILNFLHLTTPGT
jgi:hypothetical protein